MPITKSRTRRELLETIRHKGKARRTVLEIIDGIATARPKGTRAPALPISISGAYERALARSVGFDPTPKPRKRRQ
jgi:hypothetical protein